MRFAVPLTRGLGVFDMIEICTGSPGRAPAPRRRLR
jgi:hypothetical protein